ncbi:invertase [Maricaulis sp. W15]|uniref:recombinase family protein n=1 Tax=Maricaulis sp. W15 TaxID=1772333 RepID=UPI000948AD2F|nr:recombinase family protein [Maricaulis sp. W15]OLF77697.1 invertase [Maricaulis sp. W15]
MVIGPQLEATGRLVGYARVSTKAQKLDLQLDALRRAGCEQIFHDHGVSGAKTKRPGLDRALAYLRTGDVLVIYKLDRLGRSVEHLAALLREFHARGIHLCALSEGIDTQTIGGKLVFHVFSAVAEFQRDLIRENTLAGLEAARERGKRLGRPKRLSAQKVREARRAVHRDGVSYAAAARRFGVSPATVWRAVAG